MDKAIQSVSSIFEAMEAGICIIRDDQIVEFMNGAMIRDFGDWTGKRCSEAFNGGPDTCDGCRSDQVFEGETVRFERTVGRVGKTYDVIELPLRDPNGAVFKLVGIWRDITEKKKSEERIRASEEDYRRLFEHVGCGVYVSSKQGKFLDANQALLEILGYENKEEFLSIDITKDLYLRPEDRKKFQDRIEREGHVVDYEVDFKRKDGTPIPVLLTAHVRYDRQGKVLGYEGIIVDQSHRKRMEKELKEARDFLNKIIMSSPNAIMAADMKGNIIIWNRAAEETLGYKAEEVIGKINIREIYPEDMAKKVMKMMRSPKYGGVGKLRSYSMVYTRRDGQTVEGDLSAAIIYDSEGREIATVGIFVDLKERLEMECRLRETQEQLFQSEKLASIGRLAAGVAHEINNPLGGIMMYGHLVLEDLPLDCQAYQNQKKLVSQAERCKSIVEGLLDFSRQREPETKPVNINRVIEDSLSLLESQALFQNIRITKSLHPHLPPIAGDRSQLQQVFMNLAINAAEAMKAGGELHVQSLVIDGFVEIKFTDTGYGIPPKVADKMFEPFFTTKANHKGTGLGLAVSHGIINKHGGRITFKSRVKKGTTFTIRLPVAKPQGTAS